MNIINIISFVKVRVKIVIYVILYPKISILYFVVIEIEEQIKNQLYSGFKVFITLHK